jgi:hypothetical protein
MLKKTISLVSVFLLALGLSAGEKVPPQILSEPGVTRLNGEQARAHISGNTEKWREGTGYYNPNGEMDVIWHKVKSKGTWQVSADGTVCLQIRDWKPGCHFYVNNNGAITLITDGKDTPFVGSRNRGVNEIVKGKKLPRT